MKSHRQSCGRKPTSEYRSWGAMKERCYYEKHARYKHYGGRGIRVCDRWVNSFENFFEDMGTKPSPKHSLDRLNVNEDYSPNNCRWATRQEQSENRTTSVKIFYNGVTKLQSEWAKEIGISPEWLYRLLKKHPMEYVYSRYKDVPPIKCVLSRRRNIELKKQQAISTLK